LVPPSIFVPTPVSGALPNNSYVKGKMIGGWVLRGGGTHWIIKSIRRRRNIPYLLENEFGWYPKMDRLRVLFLFLLKKFGTNFLATLVLGETPIHVNVECEW
jgi:hypothetical protein